MKYQQYMRDYLRVIHSIDKKYWSIIELFRKDRIIREHNDCLHFRPRILYGRTRMVR
mgnify:CR=1 FL=1